MTYFETLKNLGFTPTRDLASPKDVEEAMDRTVAMAEIGRCFAAIAQPRPSATSSMKKI